MLKRIGVGDLRIGMHLHELCGSWMDHPFWRSSIMLDNAKDIQLIRDSNIKEVWIDTSKGLDVAGNEANIPTKSGAYAPAVAAARPITIVTRVSMEEEIGRATKICAMAKHAVTLMFHEARMGKALDAGGALSVVEEISSSVMRNPGALIGLARLKTKDDYTYMHSVAVCALMVSLSRQLNLDEAQTRDAGLAGLLHDIGKMAIPMDILNKPGKLTDDEFVTIKEHPQAGHKILLEGNGVAELAMDVCLHHHEKVDGSGYPFGLSGDQISSFAKMGAVCDVYDAITSDRPYKLGWDPAEAVRRMAEWSKGHFDDTVFQAFVKSIGIYPVSTLVRMESGRLGVVVEQSEKSLLSPKVKIFYSTKALAYLPPQILDLSAPGLQDKIVGREDAAKWGLKNVNDFWLGATVR